MMEIFRSWKRSCKLSLFGGTEAAWNKMLENLSYRISVSVVGHGQGGRRLAEIGIPHSDQVGLLDRTWKS